MDGWMDRYAQTPRAKRAQGLGVNEGGWPNVWLANGLGSCALALKGNEVRKSRESFVARTDGGIFAIDRSDIITCLRPTTGVICV